MSEIDKIIETLNPYKHLDDYADSYLLPQEKRYLNSIGVNVFNPFTCERIKIGDLYKKLLNINISPKTTIESYF